jgi:hypothetical protein
MVSRQDILGSMVERYCFPAKRIGYGWGIPRTWEGWAAFVTFLAVAIGSGYFLSDQPVLAVAAVLLASAAFLRVCIQKGEPPSWRWR